MWIEMFRGGKLTAQHCWEGQRLAWWVVVYLTGRWRQQVRGLQSHRRQLPSRRCRNSSVVAGRRRRCRRRCLRSATRARRRRRLPSLWGRDATGPAAEMAPGRRAASPARPPGHTGVESRGSFWCQQRLACHCRSDVLVNELLALWRKTGVLNGTTTTTTTTTQQQQQQ